jgi:hypothetical protein
MKAVDRCPACDGHFFQPFSFTVESERKGAMHFCAARCRDCDLVFANPVAEPDEVERFYRADATRSTEQV